MEAGRPALIVLGGPSGCKWREIYDQLDNPVLIGVNGSIQMFGPRQNERILDYWLGLEIDDIRAKTWIPFNTHGQAAGLEENSPVKILHWQSRRRYHVKPETGKTEIETGGFDLTGYDWTIRHEHEPHIREMNQGLAMGPQPGNGEPQDGTATSTSVHFAGVLGCTEAHTVGSELCWRDEDQFWYPNEPRYGHSKSKAASLIEDYRNEEWKDHPYYGLVTMRW